MVVDENIRLYYVEQISWEKILGRFLVRKNPLYL